MICSSLKTSFTKFINEIRGSKLFPVPKTNLLMRLCAGYKYWEQYTFCLTNRSRCNDTNIHITSPLWHKVMNYSHQILKPKYFTLILLSSYGVTEYSEDCISNPHWQPYRIKCEIQHKFRISFPKIERAFCTLRLQNVYTYN